MFRASSLAILNRVFAVIVFVLLMASSAWSVSYEVLHNFMERAGVPTSGLTMDAAGNAFGTTWPGENELGGAVYELTPKTGYQVIYHFSVNRPTGFAPQGNLVFDSAGNLYGTTVEGGKLGCIEDGCGVVFELSPPANGVGLWTETVLYTFCVQTNCADGAFPQSGVIFDSAGNLYGTTSGGGNNAFGTAFELSPTPSGWTETVLYNFCSQANCVDGRGPYGGLALDAAGNLYGTTQWGGSSTASLCFYEAFGCGTAFELSPQGSVWTLTTLYDFCSQASCADGAFPLSGLTFDSGNLYGTTSGGGTFGCGNVFELTPGSGGNWAEAISHTLNGLDGCAPVANVVFDSSGNLYGTTVEGGAGGGTVFKLTPEVGGQWREMQFNFPPGCALGCSPHAPVALDSDNNIYGTTTNGSDVGGVIFRITQ